MKPNMGSFQAQWPARSHVLCSKLRGTHNHGPAEGIGLDFVLCPPLLIPWNLHFFCHKKVPLPREQESVFHLHRLSQWTQRDSRTGPHGSAFPKLGPGEEGRERLQLFLLRSFLAWGFWGWDPGPYMYWARAVPQSSIPSPYPFSFVELC